ncbi:MAG: hypothetical protein KKF66_00780, partial [Actinobacteria bacterium]|nr:hypothetical protein [Actinomycetota bacterium]
MTLGTTISRVTGFIRVAALAAVLGLTARGMADSFNLANITPNIIYDMIIGGVLASLFIPVFIEYMKTRGEEEAWYIANSVFNITLVLLSVTAVALCIAAPYVIKAQTFLSHGRSQMQADATFLLRFFIFEIIFYGICASVSGTCLTHATISTFPSFPDAHGSPGVRFQICPRRLCIHPKMSLT